MLLSLSVSVLSGNHTVVSDSVTPWTRAHQAPLSMEFSSKNTGVGCHSLLQGISIGLLSNAFILYQAFPSPLN